MKTLLFACIALLAAGCASPWQANFQPNPELEGRKFPPTQSVQIRPLEFERLQRYAESERKERINSTTAPEDFTADQRLAAKNRLLETLQLQERGNEIEILGWSEFAYDEKLNLFGKPLQDFAKKIGADYVVVASEYGGTVMRTVDRPLTTYSNVYSLRGRRRGGMISEQSTTWIPTNVIEDRYFYTAAFLRKTGRDNAAGG